MNNEQINSDKKVLASLEAEYNRVRRVTDSVRAFTTDLNFEDLVPDSQERCLMVDQLQAYDYIRINLMNRIRFYRARIKRQEGIKDWTQYKRTDSTYIGVDISLEGDHHCGQDADMDDACCQAREKDSPLGEFQNIHIHKGNIPSEQQGCIKNLSLIGMQVIAIGDQRCEGCRQDRYGNQCVKLELVGGTYLCLAPLPNSIVTE